LGDCVVLYCSITLRFAIPQLNNLSLMFDITTTQPANSSVV
jgi:hypothetical protein